jgi:N,N'-diacetyllegionaminate synthase
MSNTNSRSEVCVEVGGRKIGAGQPCFVIAEAGVNHNGDPLLARKLIDAARSTGADVVKFQTFVAEKLVVPNARTAAYQEANLHGEASQFAMLKKLEMPYAEFHALKSHAASAGILLMSTPFDAASCDFLVELGVPALKLGSGEITNLPFLRHAALKNLPVILSTGMASLSEVEAAVRVFVDAGNTQLVLLHCVSDYPARPADCNLRAMETLRRAFGFPVGYSDHTMGHDVATAAVALGACLIEKHLTLDTSMPGPDHIASLNPEQFTALVRAIRDVESALGDGVKRPMPSEMNTREVVQKVFVAARALAAGEKIDESSVVLLRAGAGLFAAQWPLLNGRTLKRDILAHTVLSTDHLL